jgi:YHS domain-containing protein
MTIFQSAPRTAGIVGGTRLATNEAWEEIMGLDPVCKMEVNPASAAAQSEWGGQSFYFCSAECKSRFDREPQRYVDDTDRAQARAHKAHPAA